MVHYIYILYISRCYRLTSNVHISLKIVFVLANNVDAGEKLCHAHFYLGPLFIKLIMQELYSIQRVNP